MRPGDFRSEFGELMRRHLSLHLQNVPFDKRPRLFGESISCHMAEVGPVRSPSAVMRHLRHRLEDELFLELRHASGDLRGGQSRLDGHFLPSELAEGSIWANIAAKGHDDGHSVPPDFNPNEKFYKASGNCGESTALVSDAILSLPVYALRILHSVASRACCLRM